MPYIYPGRQLASIIDNMTDDERYSLLATLRTGEKLSDKDQQLRWYFLRGIVIRAYKHRCHYYINRAVDWHQLDWAPGLRKGSTQPSINYYKETGLILGLSEYIKGYPQPPGKNSDVIAVRKALRAYYMNMSSIETHAYMSEFGVSFLTKNRKGEVKSVMYRELTTLEVLLKKHNMSISDALQDWAQQQEERYSKWLKGELQVNRVDRVTPARLLGMYIKLVRHLTARSLAAANTFTDVLCEFNDLDNIHDLDDLDIIDTTAVAACHNVSLYLDNLKQQAKYANQKIYGNH